MKSLDHIVGIAQLCPRPIVLPEATDPRMLEAARNATDSKTAHVKLVGNPGEIDKVARGHGISLDGVEIVDQLDSERLEEYAALFSVRRKHKGVTFDQALGLMKNPLYYAAMMVKEDDAEGMVAGAVNSTGNVIRASIQTIGCLPGIKTVSSSFVMIVPDCVFGAYGAFMFADCGVVPDPNEDQLADIAIATSEMMRNLIGVEPVIAMLSFSTWGSATHPAIDKMKKAADLVRERLPDLKIDGELQADAAIIESIGRRKAPESGVAGRANVLIFPDLNAGNIAYKLTERLARAKAYGPLLQGLALPVNDLSRGCSATDIYNVIAITTVEAQAVKSRCKCELARAHGDRERANVVFPCDKKRERIFSEVFEEFRNLEQSGRVAAENAYSG